jgi:hypothetical protein
LASAVAVDSSATSLISAVGVAWAPAVVIVSAVSGVPADAVVLTAVDVQWVPAVARVFVVAAILIAVDVPSATGVSNVS